jgi:hypothetical protein
MNEGLIPMDGWMDGYMYGWMNASEFDHIVKENLSSIEWNPYGWKGVSHGWNLYLMTMGRNLNFMNFLNIWIIICDTWMDEIGKHCY